MTLYSKEARKKADHKYATEWVNENVSHYEGENGNISIEEYFKLSPYEQNKGKYQAVFKKHIPINPSIDNLLPCPFCGSKPEWINEAIADDHFYIRCSGCFIVMKADRRDKVIGMWNTRFFKPPRARKIKSYPSIYDIKAPGFNGPPKS